MKLKDFDFRLVLTPEIMADIVCDNKDCPCQTPLLYVEQARNHFNDPLYKNCEVELWTGYIDTKGIRIYENDIIRTDKDEIFQVVQDGEVTAWGLLKDDRPYCSLAEVMFESERVEVIGNTHENADLLKKEKEFVLIKTKYSDMYDSKGFPKY